MHINGAKQQEIDLQKDAKSIVCSLSEAVWGAGVGHVAASWAQGRPIVSRCLVRGLDFRFRAVAWPWIAERGLGFHMVGTLGRGFGG